MTDSFDIGNVRHIRWKQLRPGMIIVGGVEINDNVPYELREYPVLTPDLLNDLSSRYQFLEERRILVAELNPAVSRNRLRVRLKRIEEQAGALSMFHAEHRAEREKLNGRFGIDENESIPQSKAIEMSFLMKDRFNSFSFTYGTSFPQLHIPSFFSEAELKLKLGDLLTGRLSGNLNIPEDQPVLLHLVVDYSFSMSQHGKLDIAASAANYFADRIPKMLLNTQVNLYAFSNHCRRVQPPFSGGEIRREDTSYASFFKKVLEQKDRNRHNKIILITDGIPSDFPEAVRFGGMIQKSGIDYTQIMLSMSEQFEEIVDDSSELTIRDNFVDPDTIPEHAERRRYTDEEVVEAHTRIGENFTSVADACNGNQIIMRIDPALQTAMVETFDRYMGFLTITKQMQRGRTAPDAVEEKPVRKWNWE